MQPDVLVPSDSFARRHIGPSQSEIAEMLALLGYKSLDELAAATVPAQIRLKKPLALGEALGEHELVQEMKNLAADNQVMRSFIGQGYYDTITPPVILRNVLENPGWYTQYTPYQAEISQGRLEALINFQQMIEDLTGLPMANASLLDEATAAAEAMHMCFGQADGKREVFWVHDATHPQTIAVMQTRAEPTGIVLKVGSIAQILAGLNDTVAGALFSYPATDGQVIDLRDAIAKVHAAGGGVACATDLLALTLLTPPGELGADIAIGSAQRFGVPMGFGGPHAAFMACRDELRRQIPGRIIGVSRDAKGKTAFRLALQTREQHIRREKATSNICTAQVLLAVMASMYGVYHGPQGLVQIATRVRAYAAVVAAGLGKLGYTVRPGTYFDTLRIDVDAHAQATILARAVERGLNLRRYDDGLGLSCDETTTLADVHDVLEAFAVTATDLPFEVADLVKQTELPALPAGVARTSAFLTHPTFSRYHAEHEMLRYINRLSAKDLSLTTSMIPLGSCTMKLNATTEMIPVTWPEFGRMHPFAPAEQWGGYKAMFDQLEAWLAEITGFAAVSLQPNSGAQGEYAGLLAIRGYHRARNEHHRTVCLIPQSAHGTNPASAVMAGMTVVVVGTAPDGTIDLVDLKKKAEQHARDLSCLMVTYPSTHGVFEEGITEVCSIVHANGGQVYMDGANMNAQVGLTRPAECGADVCHLNLHKTFCLAAGTPVALAGGTSMQIESLVRGGRVQAWSEQENGIRPSRLEAAFRTGRKSCVRVTLQDGRTITCTPDHRMLTTQGWVEAGKLTPSHRVVCGPEAPLDTADGDERAFVARYGDLDLAMDSHLGRERALAFFRLLGALYSDGTYSQSTERGRTRRRIRLYFGTAYDARQAVVDIAQLSGMSPAISKARSVFAVTLPQELVAAIEDVPGIGTPGKKVISARTLPDAILDPATPQALVREFLAALFGGDGCAPTILHLIKAPPTLKSVRFAQTHADRGVLRLLQQEIAAALARLGIESTSDRITAVRESQLANHNKASRWTGGLTIVDGLAFAEKIGFRYCAHKSVRLSVAAAYWRMKRTVNAQRVEVAKRALANVSAKGMMVRSGPRAVWSAAVEGAYREVAGDAFVLSPYYASFAGTKRVSKQVLTNAVNGQQSDGPKQRATHRRVLAAAAGRGGASTGVLDLKDFLADTGASGLFNKHSRRGESYKVTYAMAQDATVQPTFHLAVVDVRPAGVREVYDLTVNELHSFLANGTVVHNCIPHGGGGPGMGPIGVAQHLAAYLPGHPLAPAGSQPVGPVSAAPWGSASILPISFAYIAMMGEPGLRRATEVAILGANYIAKRLGAHYPVLYTGRNGRVAHELILDCRGFKKTAGIEAEDIAKRLMDYGFHAPTMSFPVPGTLMIEPTESEAKVEIDRFIDAMIAIRGEIAAIESGQSDKVNNPLKNAPHTAAAVTGTEWDRPYTREQAAYPAPWLRVHKYWPPVARVDNAYGDRNLVCACPPLEAYSS